jgi:DNA-binding response OmpR family regulator
VNRLLLIEDDADIATALRHLFASAGYEVVPANDIHDDLREVRADLVVLDVGLPEMDGWQVLERLRDISDVPVLVLTGHVKEADKVRGLRGGADDYLTKPFANAELLARVEALLRRAGDSSSWTSQVYDDGVVHVDPTQRRVYVNGDEVRLTPTEFRLLNALVRHAGAVLSANQLLTHAWDDPTGIGQERVKFAVLRLRRKLGWTDPETSPIEAVRGFGYRYRRPGTHTSALATAADPVMGGHAVAVADLAALQVTAHAEAIVEQAADRVREMLTGDIAVQIYLDTNDNAAARRVFALVDALAGLAGMRPPYDETIRLGSFWRTAKTTFQRGLASDAVITRLCKVERAIELTYLDTRQSQVDATEAAAAADLFTALADVPRACIRLGSIFLVKYTDPEGPVIHCRNLSPLEMRALDRYPEIQTNPELALEALALAAAALDHIASETRDGQQQ